MRDYNQELLNKSEHQYMFDFDVKVMHPYMVRAMKTFLKDGKTLEMGSYKGYFSKLLQKTVSNLECIEASSDAVAEFKSDPALTDITVYNDTS